MKEFERSPLNTLLGLTRCWGILEAAEHFHLLWDLGAHSQHALHLSSCHCSRATGAQIIPPLNSGWEPSCLCPPLSGWFGDTNQQRLVPSQVSSLGVTPRESTDPAPPRDLCPHWTPPHYALLIRNDSFSELMWREQLLFCNIRKFLLGQEGEYTEIQEFLPCNTEASNQTLKGRIIAI